MATVEMTFTPLPAHVRTARLVATAMARRSGVAEALLDEVRLAVGEACSRAVEVHQAHCPAEPVRVALSGSGGRFEVVVTNNAGHAEGGGTGWLPYSPAGVASGVASPAGVASGVASPAGAGARGAPAAPGARAASPAGGAPAGTAVPRLPPVLPAELGLAVIAGLADDVQVSRTGSGLSIKMSWPSQAATG